MNRRVVAIAPMILLLIISSIAIPALTNLQPESSARSQHVSPSTTLSVNQTVTGTLTFNTQQASYGIHLDPGQYNITLNVSSAANLGFQVSRWVLGIPTFITVATISPPGVGRNSSTLLLLPTIGIQTPGDYVIRIYPSTTSTLGTYWLRVQQISYFQTIPVNQRVNSTGWVAPRALLYEVNIPQFATYNITLTTNSVASLGINLYEDDIYLPFASFTAINGRASFLAPLRTGDVYFEASALVAPGTSVRGSFSVNSTSTATLSVGSTIQGTIRVGREVDYYANLPAGYYYNLTLQVPLGENLDLFAYSPTTGNTPIAQSTNPSLGATEGISNLVVFNSRSYAVNLQGAYQTGGFQAAPDRVLIGVRNITVSSPSLRPFNLTLTRQPFPTLTPSATTNVYLNSTTGPFYRFYTSTQTSPAVYNITYQYKVWGTATWSNGIILSAAEKSYKLATTPSTGVNLLYNQHLYFTPQSFQYATERWITESISNTTFNSNTFSRNFTMGIPVFAYMESSPIYIGAKLEGLSGHSAYNGTLSYTQNGATVIPVGSLQSDFLRSDQISLYKTTLKAGHTYRVNLQFVSMNVLSTVYSTTGFLQPTTPPLFNLIFVTDSNLNESAYYYLFTPTVTADYFIVNSGPIFLAGTPDTSYTLQIQEVAPPSLSLTLNIPASQEIGQPFTLTATVTNNGNFEAENVTLSPSFTGLTSTNTPTTMLGTLSPGASAQVTWNLNSTSPGNYPINVQASSNNTPSIQTATSILITSPTLQVTISAPASAYPGGSFKVQVNVKNNGNAPAGLTAVQLLIPSGLTTSSSSQTIANIAPGQTQSITWTVSAQNSGDYTITATANEQYAGSATATTSFSVPPPWGDYLLIGVIGSLLAAFILGVLFDSNRKSGRKRTLPPPSTQPTK